MDWAMVEKGYNQPRICALAGIDLRVCMRRLSRPEDAELRKKLNELFRERRRFGYRRLHLLLWQEGWQVNWKKRCRIGSEKSPQASGSVLPSHLCLQEGLFRMNTAG